MSKKVKHYWCYLAINFDRDEKTNTHIEKSRYPVIKFWRWMIVEKKKGTKRKKKEDPQKDQGEDGNNWILELVIGPFSDDTTSESFKQRWIKESRGIIPRREKGIEMAKEFDLIVYDMEVKKAEKEKLKMDVDTPKKKRHLPSESESEMSEIGTEYETDFGEISSCDDFDSRS